MIYKTCVSIAERTPKKLEKAVIKALTKSQLVEIRFDFLKPNQIPDALEITKKYMKNTVCTLRPKSEGGNFAGGEEERISILKLIAEYCPFLLDVEFNTLEKNTLLVKYLKKSKTDLLVSWHDFDETPARDTLQELFKNMKKISKNIKIVTTAKTLEDSASVLGLYSRAAKINLVAFAMGDLGRLSRMLCLYLGSPFTYVSLGKPVAPGQFSIDEVNRMNVKISRQPSRKTK